MHGYPHLSVYTASMTLDLSFILKGLFSPAMTIPPAHKSISLFFYWLLFFIAGISPNDAWAEHCKDPTLSSVNRDITKNEHWTRVCSPYHLIKPSIRIRALLTIDAGVEIRIAKGVNIQIGADKRSNSAVGMKANGTRQRPIIFTSDEANPTPGDWDGIGFLDFISPKAVQLHGVIIRFAGGQHSFSWVSNMPGIAIFLNATSTAPELKDVIIENSAGYGLAAYEDVAFDKGSLDIQITGCALAAAAVPADTVASFPRGTYSGNGINAVEIISGKSGLVTRSGLWKNLHIPYHVMDDLTWDNTAAPDISIEKGTTFKIAEGHRIMVQAGRLVARGGSAAPITFTSLNGTATWGPMILKTPTSEFSFAKFSYGGGRCIGGTLTMLCLLFTGNPPPIENTSFSNSATGAYCIHTKGVDKPLYETQGHNKFFECSAGNMKNEP